MPKARKREWFDDDSYWRDLYPFMFRDSRIAAATEEAAKAIRLTKPRGKMVLDLCCGPGRFSVALAKRGFAVTGVDRTRYLLDKARARARAARVKVEWIQQDMRDFIRPDAFDLALSMFTSFGYFDDKREDLQVLRNISGSLRPGGACLVDLMGKERLAKILVATSSETLADGTRLVQRHEIVEDWTRIRNEWILIRKGRAKSFKFDLTIYSGQELKERMEQAGFADVRLYGNLDGSGYGPQAERLIAVGRKPGVSRRAGGPGLMAKC
jgi:SAM-dependent methyltransferase